MALILAKKVFRENGVGVVVVAVVYKKVFGCPF
jgi:hypothetical protein